MSGEEVLDGEVDIVVLGVDVGEEGIVRGRRGYDDLFVFFVRVDVVLGVLIGQQGDIYTGRVGGEEEGLIPHGSRR